MPTRRLLSPADPVEYIVNRPEHAEPKPIRHDTDPGEMPRHVLEHELDCAWQILEEHRRIAARARSDYIAQCAMRDLERPFANQYKRIAGVVSDWDARNISAEAAMAEVRKLVIEGNSAVARIEDEQAKKRANRS